MPGVSLDHAAVVEADVAALRKAGDGKGVAVFIFVVALAGRDGAGEPDPVARRQHDAFRPVE